MLTWPSHFEGIKIKISELSKCGFSCECRIFSQIYIVHMAKLSAMPNYSKDLFGGSCENCWHTPVLGGQSCYAVRNLTGVTLCEILRSIVWHTGMACIANTLSVSIEHTLFLTGSGKEEVHENTEFCHTIWPKWTWSAYICTLFALISKLCVWHKFAI